MSNQDDQSSGKTGIANWTPWSRSPQPAAASKTRDSEKERVLHKAADHVVTHRHRLSLKKYPRDCPPLRVQWFHAVDIAKRRPHANDAKNTDKAPPVPKKYAAFTNKDSKALEAAYQKLVEEDEQQDHQAILERQKEPKHDRSKDQDTSSRSLGEGRVKIPVNEDYLFDVDVERRELGPAYWLGPIYDVRRGTWFYQEGSVQKPCDENLAAQLEEGYLKIKPWVPREARPRSQSQTRTRPSSWAPDVAAARASTAKDLSSKGSNPDLASAADTLNVPRGAAEPGQGPDNTYRLFGSHMNSVVTYSDATTAWLSTEDFLSKINYNMYQRFGGGGHFGGVKLSRGFNYAKKPDPKEAKPDEASLKVSTSDSEVKAGQTPDRDDTTSPRTPAENRRQTLERHMSYLLEDPNTRDPARQDEEQRLRDEQEIEDDYREADNEDQGRPIEHLILVTHGIGQRLGLRLESVNFVHDVNMLRKTLKAVYSDSPDLRALNAELDSSASKINSRVQVLPICWRHLLDFPKHSLRQGRPEHDIVDSGHGEYEEYPSLSDISVEGVPAVRNLISDLALDILLYQSPAYKDHISRIVLEECNRIYALFLQRNPDFRGKVSMIGHSLGSAIMFDILCRQGGAGVAVDKRTPQGHKGHMKLSFEVADFYALGSPIGLFQMLKGEGIAARKQQHSMLGARIDDPMLDSQPSSRSFAREPPQTHPGEFQYSRPHCDQVFNIFHPTDPIAYRLEPLISRAMASLKPQPLPYTKRGIFGAPVGQGLTGIGARVGQSVSSFWSSMSSGLASSLLVRGLGYTEDGQSNDPQGNAKDAKSNAPLSLAAGVAPQNNKPGPAQTAADAASADIKQAQLANDALVAGAKGQHPPTLIDQDIETLSSGFERRKKTLSSDSNTRDLGATHTDLAEIEERGRRLRQEEDKVRKLNSNGRVDYAIQEGAFDINLLAAIASHLSYWGDEDVSHFMISQLLSRSQVDRIGRHRVRSRGGRA